MDIISDSERNVKLEDNRRKGWWWAYDDVFDLEIPAHAKLIYLYLCRRADKEGESFPSRATIARDCSLSINSVRRSLKKLIQVDILKVQSGKEAGSSNVYCLADRQDWQGGVGHRGLGGRPQGPTRVGHRGPQKDYSVEGQPSKDSQSESTEISTLPDEDLRFLVGEFYSGIDQATISTRKGEKGAKVLQELLKDGFGLDDLTTAFDWVAIHQEKLGGVHSIGILPEIMGQAQEWTRGRDEEAKRRQEEAERQRQLDAEAQVHLKEQERQRQEQEKKQAALERRYLSLPEDERNKLQEQARATLPSFLTKGGASTLVERTIHHRVISMMEQANGNGTEARA